MNCVPILVVLGAHCCSSFHRYLLSFVFVIDGVDICAGGVESRGFLEHLFKMCWSRIGVTVCSGSSSVFVDLAMGDFPGLYWLPFGMGVRTLCRNYLQNIRWVFVSVELVYVQEVVQDLDGIQKHVDPLQLCMDCFFPVKVATERGVATW